jgi:hypothetical protein
MKGKHRRKTKTLSHFEIVLFFGEERAELLCLADCPLHLLALWGGLNRSTHRNRRSTRNRRTKQIANALLHLVRLARFGGGVELQLKGTALRNNQHRNSSVIRPETNSLLKIRKQHKQNTNQSGGVYLDENNLKNTHHLFSFAHMMPVCGGRIIDPYARSDPSSSPPPCSDALEQYSSERQQQQDKINTGCHNPHAVAAVRASCAVFPHVSLHVFSAPLQSEQPARETQPRDRDSRGSVRIKSMRAPLLEKRLLRDWSQHVNRSLEESYLKRQKNKGPNKATT